MEVGRYQFTLLPADDDPEPESKEFLANVQMIRDDLSAGELTFITPVITSNIPGLIGEVLVPMTQAVGPVIGAVVGSIMMYKANRKIRVKSGPIEIEAYSAEQAIKLFDHAASKVLPQDEEKKA